MRRAVAFSIIALQSGILFACGVLAADDFSNTVCERSCGNGVAAFQVDADQAPKKDLAKLQGEWIAVALERDGAAVSAPDVKKLDIRLIIKSSEFMLMPFASKGPEHFPFGTFKLHATKEPKAIDFAVAPFFSSMKAHTELGIYAFEGDRLKLLRGLPDKARPTAFVTTRKSGLEIIVFQRAK